MQGPYLQLNNGVAMPALGLGVFQSSAEDTTSSVRFALESGYRLIDTAAAYMNEEHVGKGMRQSGIDRSEVFVTTKAWISDYGYDRTLHAFDRSIRKLDIEQLDLYLLHWPAPDQFEKTIESWKAAEKLLAEGRVRAIGVSNFNSDYLAELMAHAEVVPAVNQIEVHPFFSQVGLRAANRECNIITQAWSPIGGVIRYSDKPAASGDPLVHPVLLQIG
jgi:diketogulonate reductase-like aldo/keto reductase